MKKSKFLKRASVIALSAVMTASVAFAAAACGGGGDQKNALGYRSGVPGRGKDDPNNLTVYIFCNDSDRQTNEAICKDYIAKYNAAHGYTGDNAKGVKFFAETDKKVYFDNLANFWSNNNMYDVMYLAPRYVRTYAETGAVLNLADYLDTVSTDPASADPKADNQKVMGQIWENALSYYSYKKTDDMSYTRGQAVRYDSEKNGFYTVASNGEEEVGLYGLPKDYSNFSTGYNNRFFSDAIKEAVTTVKATANRSVSGGSNPDNTSSVSSQRKYDSNTGNKRTGRNAPSVVQYAVTDTYTNPYTDESMSAKDGDPAPIINIGVPTRYYPFNFFRYNTYQEALDNGDPLACLCEAYTDYDGDGNADGYVVTIPGFPNDVVEIPDSVAKDPNAPYDTSVGHITYTYAEYAAFIWAMTYYLNTFDWQTGHADNGEWVAGDGLGGVKVTASNGKVTNMTVFGGEQYEGNSGGAVGTVLYLLPWLYGNDADLINLANALCVARDESQKVIGEGANIANAADWRDVVGKASNNVTKKNLDGSVRNVAVQYGFNSERFIETYGAFLALASDWNGNNGGDGDDASTVNGWGYFRQGRALFYGAGSWDGATRNDTAYDILEFGQMPTPVSENYALYSKIKGANYTMEEYSNGATAKGTGDAAANDGVQRPNKADGKIVYDKDAIAMNQALRQDKWGARMDSVGYAVNGQVTNYEGDHAWKAEAAVGMVMALTIDRDAQITLTYAGAQYPNFRDQMEQFVDYQKYGSEGAFKDMITPEGTATMKYYDENGKVDETVAAQAKSIWDQYYAIAQKMNGLVNNASQNNKTVAEILKDEKVNGEAVKYDATYANTQIKSFSGSSTTDFLAFCMKVLRMVPMTKMNREINIRMQYGLNAVRDSTMYTYSDAWVTDVDARNALDTMLAYTRGKTVKVGNTAINSGNLDVFRNGVKQNPTTDGTMWETPVVYVLRRAQLTQTALSNSVAAEADALSKMNKK